jgi:hypothetical protein
MSEMKTKGTNAYHAAAAQGVLAQSWNGASSPEGGLSSSPLAGASRAEPSRDVWMAGFLLRRRERDGKWIKARVFSLPRRRPHEALASSRGAIVSSSRGRSGA